MPSRLRWLLLQLTRTLWVRAALFAVLGVVTSLISIVIGRHIPGDWPAQIGADAVDRLLGILASSMLSVTTFSLGVIVAAYSAATTSVSPRATRLLMQDTATQNMLATFIGSFLFSLVGIIGLSAGVYGDRGRLVLFAVTLVVIALIVMTLLRWIEHISRLGRVGETTDLVEQATLEAVRERTRRPRLAGTPLQEGATLADARAVRPERIGYVEHIDMQALSSLADEHDLQIQVDALPGTFVHPARSLVRIDGGSAEQQDDIADEARSAFSIGDERAFDQDPRFGFCVLAEIASRALSPAVNDPGTAIDVISRSVRVLAEWNAPEQAEAAQEIEYPRIHVPAITVDELYDDVFGPIARDGAALIEVQLRLQKALQALAAIDPERFGEAGLRHARRALAHSDAAIVSEQDKARLHRVAEETERIVRSRRAGAGEQ